MGNERWAAGSVWDDFKGTKAEGAVILVEHLHGPPIALAFADSQLRKREVRHIYPRVTKQFGDARAPADSCAWVLPMMIVPNYVGPSAIEGVGIFAAAPIKAGDPIWILEDKFDLLLRSDTLETLPELQREFIERYGYPHMSRPGIIVLEYDNGRFMNHSATPNTDFRNADIAWARCDIAEGEELTCDYAEFDPSFVMQPGRTFAADK